MSVFDLDQKGQQAIAEEARLNPLDTGQVKPGAFTGVGTGIGMGVMRGGAKVGQFVGMAGAVVPMAIDKLTEGDNFSGQSLTDSYFEGVDKTVNRAVDRWTPSAAEVGKVGHVLGGLSEIVLPLMAGGGNPTMLIGAQEMGTATELVRQGVDADTAAKAGLLQGGATAIGFRLPAAFGSNLAQRLATGAGVNLAVGVPQRAATASLLEAAKRPDLADAYGNSTDALAVDVLTGLVFGGLAHVQAPKFKPSDADAVLTASNAKHFQHDTAPGTPADPAASTAHQSAMDTAIQQLVRGERVNVAESITEADFIKKPESPIGAAIREAYGIEPDKPITSGARGIRNNNPGNIEISGQQWQGQVSGNDPRFATFDTPEAGIRALAKNLITYQDKHGLNTVESIINRWAPPKENQTSAYVQAVAKEVGVKPGDPINVRDPAVLAKLTGAIIRHENGAQPYQSGTIDTGVKAALSGAMPRKPDEMLAAMPRAKALPELDRKVETRLAEKITNDYPAAVMEYNALPDAMGGKVLNVDTARELSPDYATSKDSRALLSAAVHEPASYFIKQIYADRLAEMPPDSTVMFTSGGTGAGKSTAIKGVPSAAQAMDGAYLVYDTNMNGLKSAQQKIEQALAAGAKVDIWHVQRDPVDALVNGALPRARNYGRAVPLDAHEATHIGAAETVVQLADHYQNDPRVTIRVLDNTRGKGSAGESNIEFIKTFDYNGLKERLVSALQKEYQDGRISDAIYSGTLGAIDAGRADSSAGLGRSNEIRVPGGLPLRQRVGDSNLDGRGSQDRGVSLQSAARQGSSQDAGIRSESVLGSESGRQVGNAGESGLQLPAQGSALSSKSFPVQGKESTAVTERGSTIATQFVAVEADRLVTSHDNSLKPNPAFPRELQPRDRARAASEAQIAKIENGINPELLAESPKASDGAPIIGTDQVVESGNARTIALRRAYDGGKADAYRSWLIENAERFGLDPKKLAKMKRPVLARVGLGEYDRAEFARQANESAVAQMSVTETARADAARMPDLMGLVANEDGTISIGASGNFIRGFMESVVSPSEQGAMITAGGTLSQQGLQRIRNAVFAKAYGDPEIVAMMAESTDANVKNILAGMLRAAPAVARLKDLIDAGARYPMDFTGDMVKAVRQFSQLRADGMTVDQFLAQRSLFDSGLSPEINNLLIGLQENAKAPKRVAEMIGRVVDTVDQLGDPRQSGMFDSLPTPKPHDVIADAVETMRAKADIKPTGDLFSTPEIEAARQATDINPEMRVVLDDGTEISAREAMARIGDDAAQAEVDAKAFGAAVNCFLRNV